MNQNSDYNSVIADSAIADSAIADSVIADSDHRHEQKKYDKLHQRCYVYAELLEDINDNLSAQKQELSDQERFNREAKIRRYVFTFVDGVDDLHRCYMKILHLINNIEIREFSNNHAYACLTLVWEIYKLHKLIDRETAFVYMDSALTIFYKMLRGINLDIMFCKFFNEGCEYPRQFDVFKKMKSY